MTCQSCLEVIKQDIRMGEAVRDMAIIYLDALYVGTQYEVDKVAARAAVQRIAAIDSHYFGKASVTKWAEKEVVKHYSNKLAE